MVLSYITLTILLTIGLLSAAFSVADLVSGQLPFFKLIAMVVSLSTVFFSLLLT